MRCSYVAALLLAACATGNTSRSREAPLRVGTCGDEPPFSKRINDTYVGIDIDLAYDLGDVLDREVVFVPTSWSTLLADLQVRRFDIAMSGINVTAEREAAGRFSRPYLNNGKQAIIRCSQAGRFANLGQLNRIGIRILTNLGGTNDAFAQNRLPDATLVSSVDTTSLYERFIAGEGDVIFTDAIEAQFRVDHHATLCLGLGGAVFDDYPVAVLMPRDSPFASAIDAWVESRKRDGFINQLVRAHSGHE